MGIGKEYWVGCGWPNTHYYYTGCLRPLFWSNIDSNNDGQQRQEQKEGIKRKGSFQHPKKENSWCCSLFVGFSFVSLTFAAISQQPQLGVYYRFRKVIIWSRVEGNEKAYYTNIAATHRYVPKSKLLTEWFSNRVRGSGALYRARSIPDAYIAHYWMLGAGCWVLVRTAQICAS